MRVSLRSIFLPVSTAALLLSATAATAQPEGPSVGAHTGLAGHSEFNTTTFAAGVDASVPVGRGISVEGALTWLPGTDGESLRDQWRVAGLAGVGVDLVPGPVNASVRARVGFIRFLASDEPFACIAIFPPPLSCTLLAGYTAFAAALGGGVRVPVAADGRLTINVDASDLLIRYDVPAVRPNGERTEGFISHTPLVTVGLGWTF